MRGLNELPDDALLLIMPLLPFWDILQLKRLNRRLCDCVSSHLKKQRTLDVSWPAARGPELSDRAAKSVQDTILSTVGRKLVKLVVNTPGGFRVFEDVTFVCKLAVCCPKLGYLPITNEDTLLTYCEGNAKTIEHLQIDQEANEDDSNEVRKEILQLCSEIKTLDISVEVGGSVGWVTDSLTKRTHNIESLHISYASLTPQLSEEIQSIVTTCTSLKEISLTVQHFGVYNEVELTLQLVKKLPLKHFHSDTYNDTLAPYFTSIDVIIVDAEFQFASLEMCEKLITLQILQQRDITVLLQLTEKLPTSVTTFKINCVDYAQFELLKDLIRRRGSQFNRLELQIDETNCTANAKDFLALVANNCPDLIELVMFVQLPAECKKPDCSVELALLTSKLRKLRRVVIMGLIVSKSAFEASLATCRQLEKIHICVAESTFERAELKAMLVKNHKLYEARILEFDGDTKRKVYEYLNGTLIEVSG
ncbi:hypothetical protein HDE_00970 [Halotydeus destructor]|nr:hypothetical protein HDE_00970 [Halotydeus destructor]